MLIPLVLFLLPLQFSPGPANIFFATMGARFGVKGAIPSIIGYIGATLAVTTAFGLGLDATVFRDPGVIRTIQGLGALYMLYLGWQFTNAARTTKEAEPDVVRVASAGAEEPNDMVLKPVGSSNFWQGAIVLLTNPKAYLIIGLSLTQFAYGGDLGTRVLAVNTILAAVCFASFVTWAAIGHGLMRALPRHQRAQNSAYAIAMFSVAGWMLWRVITG